MDWLITIVACGCLLVWYWHYRRAQEPQLSRTAPGVLYQSWSAVPYNLGQLTNNGLQTRHWDRAILSITPEGITLSQKYGRKLRVHIEAEELRGFWYQAKSNRGEVRVHAHIGSSWHVLMLRLYDLSQCVDALETLTPRSHLSHAPFRHEPSAANQLHATDQADERLALYLAPLTLVVLRHNLVRHTFRLSALREIHALDADDGGAVLHFSAEGRQWAFALEDAELWAQNLAAAAQSASSEARARV